MKILKRILRRGTSGTGETAFGVTDVGNEPDDNEDCYLLLPEIGIYAVADGMGGHNAGGVASLNAVKIVGEYLVPERVSMMKHDEQRIKDEMVQAVTNAHEHIAEMSRTKKEYSGMGSTIVVSFIHDHTLHTCHVGDSRVYVVNGFGITQITNDHSTVGEMVRLGRMTRIEAIYSPLKNEITQALGAPFSVSPEYNQRSLKKNDVVLLCSDGLWDMLLDDEIHTIIARRGTLKEAGRKLIQQANAAGGADNITVILIQINGNTEVTMASTSSERRLSASKAI